MSQLITYLTIRIKTTELSRDLCQFQFAGLWPEEQDLAFFQIGSSTDSYLHRLDYLAEIYKQVRHGITIRSVMKTLSKEHSKKI